MNCVWCWFFFCFCCLWLLEEALCSFQALSLCFWIHVLRADPRPQMGLVPTHCCAKEKVGSLEESCQVQTVSWVSALTKWVLTRPDFMLPVSWPSSPSLSGQPECQHSGHFWDSSSICRGKNERVGGGKANWLWPLLPFSIIHAGLERQKRKVQHLLVCHLSAGQRALALAWGQPGFPLKPPRVSTLGVTPGITGVCAAHTQVCTASGGRGP